MSAWKQVKSSANWYNDELSLGGFYLQYLRIATSQDVIWVITREFMLSCWRSDILSYSKNQENIFFFFNEEQILCLWVS